MKRALVILGGVVVAVLLAIQAVPPEYPRDNPPSTATIEGPPEVVEILRRSCFDCHSNETEWPFYAWIAPISWTVTQDVAGGRARLNFSDWEDMREARRRRHAAKVVERVEAGEMPMPRYLWLHPDASVSDEELEVLRSWRDELAASESNDVSSGEPGGGSP